jgi:uncharacterized membrane protein YjgN (DUF898 family)
MKNYFKAEINGKGFFKTYILFLIAIVVLGVFSTKSGEATFISTIASLAESYVSMLLGFAFFCYAVKSIFFKDEGFSFTGTLGRFAPKVLKWFLLTVITFGIYSPWYLRNYIDYYLENLCYKGEKAEFLSSPGKLLKYMLLTLYLPILVLIAIMMFFLISSFGNYSPFSITIFTFAIVIVVFLVMIPFLYFYFAWLINVKFSGYKVGFNRTIAETAGFLIGQILLTIITLGIYYPAALVKGYRFLLSGSSLTDERDQDVGVFGFDGTATKGFCLLWGQGLLAIITIGIYGSWAMSKVTNWFANNTYVEGDFKIRE